MMVFSLVVVRASVVVLVQSINQIRPINTLMLPERKNEKVRKNQTKSTNTYDCEESINKKRRKSIRNTESHKYKKEIIYVIQTRLNSQQASSAFSYSFMFDPHHLSQQSVASSRSVLEFGSIGTNESLPRSSSASQ